MCVWDDDYYRTFALPQFNPIHILNHNQTTIVRIKNIFSCPYDIR